MVPSSPAIRVMALAAVLHGRSALSFPNWVNRRAGAWQVSFPPEMPGGPRQGGRVRRINPVAAHLADGGPNAEFILWGAEDTAKGSLLGYLPTVLLAL
jgi:hypothetical protein